MGQEAGAVSLGMLLLSPLCKGLLKQAILLSGEDFKKKIASHITHEHR